MREVKFRAWDGIRMTTRGISFNSTTGDLSGTVYGVDSNEINMPVMQYTGLKDKNGAEIYEGDIVKSWNLTNGLKEPAICEVVWNRNFYATKRVDGGGSTGLHISDGDFGVEVIGNIYENPDLLTSGT